MAEFEDACRTPRLRRAAFAILRQRFGGNEKLALKIWTAKPIRPYAGDDRLHERDNALWLAWHALIAADNEDAIDPGDPPKPT